MPRRSSLESPKPTIPRSAYRTARRASVRASSGCFIRFAATSTRIPSPVSRDALSTASRMISRAGISPPSIGAYDVGSTWISSHPEPSRTSSSAASRTSRWMSSGSRRHDRAASYSRWKRNQPRSSVARSFGGSPLVRASGRCTPYLSARSSSVPGRIDPVKCRCRWAFGSSRTSRTLNIPRSCRTHEPPGSTFSRTGGRPNAETGPRPEPGTRSVTGKRPRQSRASASSFWIRDTPSTRSSSPSAYESRR